MKKNLLILLSITLFFSCQSYFGKKTYKRLNNHSSEINKLNTKGYYSFEDSTYHYYNFQRGKILTGKLKPQDSVKLLYSNFIILKDDKTGYVNITTRYDGLNYSVYDSSILASGINSKDSIHDQFIKWAKLNKLLDDKLERISYPAQYQVKNDSISINYFQYIIDGKSTLYELKGPILDKFTFKITSKKRYRTVRFGKEKIYKTSMIFKFEELDKIKVE